MELKDFIVAKMLEIVKELKKYDPDARYLSITYMDDIIQFNNDYYDRPEAVKLSDAAYELEYAHKLFDDLDPTLDGIMTFTE